MLLVAVSFYRLPDDLVTRHSFQTSRTLFWEPRFGSGSDLGVRQSCAAASSQISSETQQMLLHAGVLGLEEVICLYFSFSFIFLAEFKLFSAFLLRRQPTAAAAPACCSCQVAAARRVKSFRPGNPQTAALALILGTAFICCDTSSGRQNQEEEVGFVIATVAGKYLQRHGWLSHKPKEQEEFVLTFQLNRDNMKMNIWKQTLNKTANSRFSFSSDSRSDEQNQAQDQSEHRTNQSKGPIRAQDQSEQRTNQSKGPIRASVNTGFRISMLTSQVECFYFSHQTLQFQEDDIFQDGCCFEPFKYYYH
ncbi:uncharacterized protein LOC114139463 [Xiphophorus couchianus]|uniref:uncharacterized protein LOC114139463 n=1 Tax=Xiphophorus couchianus TaxID=32473 RepID=UPI0010162EA3|nr:uncharacterized protein LOC114139463 [Xiphophorus couchianus]